MPAGSLEEPWLERHVVLLSWAMLSGNAPVPASLRGAPRALPQAPNLTFVAVGQNGRGRRGSLL